MFRKTMLVIGLCVFVILALNVCLSAAEQTDDDVAAIQALTAAWCTAIEAGDVAGILALYSDDIVRMQPNAPISRGKQAIEEFLRGAFEQFTFEVTWPIEGTEEIIVADGWAFLLSEYIEKFTPKAGGEAIEDYGKIVEICQKQPDGSWKFAREIWNHTSPPDKD